jgi:hypothetical protein
MSIFVSADKVPIVKNVPDEFILLFFGKIDDWLGYCVLFGPQKDNTFRNGERFIELRNAKLATGPAQKRLAVQPVINGIIFPDGKGMAETRTAKIGFCTEMYKPSHYEGMPLEEVYHVYQP